MSCGSDPAGSRSAMRPFLRSAAFALSLAPVVAAAQTAARNQSIPSPSEHLGFQVGADRTLADWGQITGYFQRLAAASPAVHVDTLGRTTDGQPFIVAVVSSPANIARLPELRAGQAKLADPRRLTPDEERRLIASQPSVIFISNNIHGSEIGGSQMAMELAYRLATVDTLQRYLAQEVVLIAPVDEPRRPAHDHGVVPQERRHQVGRRPVAVALSLVRGSRQQSRLVHGDAEGDASRHRLSLRPMVPGGLLRRTPDGGRGRADLRSATRGSGEPESGSDDRARHRAHRRRDGARARGA